MTLWPDNPAKWFLHSEGKFRLHRIVSQQTMLDHCLHAISADQSDVVMDLMGKCPSDNAYAELKSTYLERRTPTTAVRVQRLHALGPLGDQRPSDLLRMIKRILGRYIQGDCSIYRYVNKYNLPLTVLLHANWYTPFHGARN